MKKITLTDKDGVQFTIEVGMLEMIWRNNCGSTIKVFGGGQTAVKESLEDICRKVVQG